MSILKSRRFFPLFLTQFLIPVLYTYLPGKLPANR